VRTASLARVRVVIAALVVVALAAPASAFAHATLIRTTPANGDVLESSPRKVIVAFDDSVRAAKGNAAVDNTSTSSVLGGAARAHGRTLVIPLQPHLRDGAYTVRWSIVSDDGHREQGVLAFAVGAGSASPTPILGAAVPLTWNDILLRTLYYFGLLSAGGAAVFWLLTRRILGDALQRPLAHLLFFSLLLVFLGGSGIVHAAPPGTRFALVLKVALTLSLVGGAAAALAPTIPRLLYVAQGVALALLAAPTLAGHALDRDQPRVLSVATDLAHMASAAVWLGGLLAIVYVVPRAAPDDATRNAAVRRFSTAALVAVAVLGVTGITRAVTELGAVSQLWSTSYGRALLVKTAVFIPLLAVGWLNRAVLVRVFARLRRSATVEVVAICFIVVAVAVLTELRPGTASSRAVAAPLAAAQPPVLPPLDAVVEGRELGSLVVAVARRPGNAMVTLVGPDNTGVDGRRVRIDGRAATGCGSGCYRAPAATRGPLRVSVGDRTLTFHTPPRAPDATRQLRALTRRYRSAKTIVFDETLASSPTNAQTTRFVVVAPNRLSFVTRDGPAGIVIGNRRWDRLARGAPWLASGQSPLDVTQPYWRSPTNAHEIAPGVFTFLDRRLPGWFRIDYPSVMPRTMRMAAAAHFMVDRYVGFDMPASVSPPPSR
jgi:copper transport protein